MAFYPKSHQPDLLLGGYQGWSMGDTYKNQVMEINNMKSANRICRICLIENSEMSSIFEEINEGVTIAQILSEFARCPAMEPVQNLPEKICNRCMVDARQVYDFKRRVENAYTVLIEWMEKNKDKCSNIVELPTHFSTLARERRDYGTQTDRLCLHPCELCDMKFFDLLDLRQHRKQVHSNSNLQCRICGLRFERIRQLRSHLVQKHPSVGIALDIQCSICRKRFSRREHLKRHLRNVHRQPEQPSTKVSLKEPEIDLSINKLRTSGRKAQLENEGENLEEQSVEKSIYPENKQNTEEQPTEKKCNVLDKTSFPVSSHFFECGQEFLDNFVSELNMDTNPISSDDEGHNNMEFSGDILPRLKLEHEPKIKVECEINESADNEFDTTNLSPYYARSNSPVDDIVKEECDLETDTSNALNGEQSEKYDERRRIAEILDEYLAQNAAADETANTENRCTKCQRSFSRHCHLRRHMLTHVEEKAHACTFCAKRFARSDHLKKHIINLHQTKEFKCNQCNGAFARSVDLAKHIEARHENDPQTNKVHDCEYCGKKFTSRTYLRKHILMHTDRVFACKFCEETFKERKAVREHEKGHHSERRNFLCSMCGESFVRNDYLRVHMRRHNGEKPYKCQYCGKGFPRATDVKIHERYHTGTKPNLCNLCGKGFHRAYNLTIHMRTHTGERPFKCEDCGRGFAQSNDLKAHIRRHTGERFKCPECDAGFLQMYALRQHAQAIHSIFMEPSTGRLQKFTPSQTTAATESTIGTKKLSQTMGDHLKTLQQNLQYQISYMQSANSIPQKPPAPSSV